MRRSSFLLCLVVLFSSGAWADSILTIGDFTFLGTNSQGLSEVRLVLDTAGITEPFLFNFLIGDEHNAVVLGPALTPITLTLAPIVPRCPCDEIFFTLVLGTGPTSIITLANGQPFTALSVNTVTILPEPGQTFIQAGQSVPITIRAAPEPGTVLLLGTGLMCLGAKWKKRKARIVL